MYGVERGRLPVSGLALRCLPLFAMALHSDAATTLRPTDWSDWQTYRRHVVHPATLIKPEDLERARRNIERNDWAKGYRDRLCASADAVVKQLDEAYLEHMLEITTPGCTGPCPACRAKGLPWHPNGQWSWSSGTPDKLSCRVCKTVFPHADFPETVVVQSTWDPRQSFSFIGGDTFRCFGYRQARPSLSGIIRARKVGHVSGQLNSVATAYALTSEPHYARAAKAILLRFAEVLPKYLVRAGYGYGEYTDCDPHVASERIGNLPNDELVYPPNKPDRKLYAGYWAASRIGSSGMDGGWVCRATEAYDLTCEAKDGNEAVYSEEERIRIERDVLLEASYLAACDTSVNNKSVGNRAGAAMVGLCVGHPELVRFGLDGFRRTVEEWFLPDGGSSESPAYALMTMGGIRAFGLAFRDYSEPEGYSGPDGARIVGFNACRDTRYGDCWQSLVWTLQGNLRHPPSADSYRTTGIGAQFAEMLALTYPTDEHFSLLRETAGATPSGGASREALLYREPVGGTRETPRLALPDVVFPYLAQGYLRRGRDGRQGLLLLNASDYGGHHHQDSLDLYLWQDGHELLSDLGYLWDHPDSGMTRRTLAHNLVLIDGQSQRGKGRGGSFHLFAVTPRVKLMEASSTAYANATEYRRTCFMVDHGAAGNYVVDIFRAGGGTVREYVFHGPNSDWTVEGLPLTEPQAETRPVRFAVRFHLQALGEIVVDDVSLRQVRADNSEGPELAVQPEGAEGQSPVGWGRYGGNGSAEWGLSQPGRGDASAVRLRATAADKDGRVNVALLLGQSDGYTGAKALTGALSATYRLRFAIRGAAERVNVGFVMWPNDPRSSSDRQHGAVSITGGRDVRAGSEWTEYEGVFTLPDRRTELANQRQADGSAPWRVTWRISDSYSFSAVVPGAPEEEVIVGDGWGQRDHRNTDRGATLPYVLRRRTKPGATDTFVTVFCGGKKSQDLVRGVRRLALGPAPVADGLVLAVETARGTDVFVSQLANDSVTFDCALGHVITDARAAAVLGRNGQPEYACMAGGARLAAPGVDLSAPAPAWGGRVLETGSGPGESCYLVEGTAEAPTLLAGATLLVKGEDGIERAYPLRDVERTDAGLRLYTKRAHVGFEARPAKTWRIPHTASWQRTSGE